MTTHPTRSGSPVSRVSRGLPTGGQFAAQTRGEADVSLDDAKVNAEAAVQEAYEAGVAEGRRRERGEEPRDMDGAVLDLTHFDLSQAITPEIDCLECDGDRTVRDFSDPHLGRRICPSCGGHGTHPPTPSGQDAVDVPGHGRFYRRHDHNAPGTPYAIRLEANRPLTDAETRRAAQLLGYGYRASVRGEPISDPVRDSDRSFIVSADTTKSRSDDVGVALEEFEQDLPDLLVSGSPVRKTDRAGAGTKGTRLVDGIGDPDLRFEIYYDDVFGYPAP